MLYTLSQWGWLLPLAGFAWYWQTAVRVKEVAYQAVARRCEQEGVQLLDGSISLGSLKVGRGDRGSISLLREYSFEFTSTGDQRYKGWVFTRGARILSVDLPPHRLN